MADQSTASSDSTTEGATPDTATTQSATTASDSPNTSVLETTLAKIRDEKRALERELREIRRSADDAARKTAEEQGQYKSLYANEQKAADELRAKLDAANSRWRDSQTNAALAAALGSHVVGGSTAHVMAALSPALAVDDDGAVTVDPTKLTSIRSAATIDTTKVRSLDDLVREFLIANPFFAASKAAGGAGGGGTGASNGAGSFDSAIAGWDKLTKDQQDKLWSDPAFRAAVSARAQKPATI